MTKACYYRVCRHRHLMLDLTQLLPHSKKDAKLDTKTETAILNEIADMKVHGWAPFLFAGLRPAQRLC